MNFLHLAQMMAAANQTKTPGTAPGKPLSTGMALAIIVATVVFFVGYAWLAMTGHIGP